MRDPRSAVSSGTPVHRLRTLLHPLHRRVEGMEQALSQPANAITFLLVRFVLMSGMVIGFSWCALNLSP
jgi:predicted Na+-dependent transporter